MLDTEIRHNWQQCLITNINIISNMRHINTIDVVGQKSTLFKDTA